MSTQVWLSLGSNIGDKLGYLQFAVEKLAEHPAVEIGRRSSVYQSAPWGVSGQDDYYNAVIELHTELSPWELLRLTQDIERQTGRKREMKWGSRELDIDILIYGEGCIETGDLRIPHPLIKDRLFVLEPLLEAGGDMDIPFKGRLSLVYAACDRSLPVHKIIEAGQW
ncbi:MAG: 2-amino-4-hydroxy-6-hydroxymethyldihydropteridine diphosphokinase [Bacillota bacterium]|nr:2-amino-4-hydroxy-6-hydroxymethyldihydropteridine diphosphokinase [Bacillota bacterium]